MAEYIGKSKGFGILANSIQFNTYVPELSDNADIQNAFELFYFGDSSDGTTLGDVSLYSHLLDFDSRITATDNAFSGHDGAHFNVHGISGYVVGTIDVQELTNKTLTSPIITNGTINGGVALTVNSTELNVLDGITASTSEINILDGITATTTEINYIDGVTSAIQTQLNTKSPSASPTFTGTVVLPSATSIGTITSTELSYVDGVTSSIQTQLDSKAASSALSLHEADTTSIHGIADTSKLARVASSSAGRTIFVQSATPTALAVGDIWFQVTGL
jgi:hypothetical protein